MSAVVTVLPLYVCMGYTGTALTSIIFVEEWLQSLHGRNSVPQKMRAAWNSVSSYSTGLCRNTECCYVISVEHGSLETSVHVGFPSV
jgi:hypothetical protein